MATYTQIPTSKKVTRKLSTAVGLLAFAAFIIQGMGPTWGFEAVSQQITQTILLVSGAINLFFLGSTTQKNIDDSTKENSDDKTK